MNTSGPSSRPRKPYPLALLNHLTVPFRRSTCAPLFFADFPLKGAIPGARKKCVGIVLLTGGTVKTVDYMARGCGQGLALRNSHLRGSLARWSRHLGQPQDAADGLGIADAAIERHPFRLRQGKKFRCDLLVRLRLGFAGPEAASQVDGHGFVEKTGADVKMQDSFPVQRAV